MIPLVSVTKNSQIRKDRGRMMGAKGQRAGGWEVVGAGDGVGAFQGGKHSGDG